MNTTNTYRIEQWTRKGQILRAEYVDELGQPYTLLTALATVDELRPKITDTALRIADGDGKPIDEIEARDTTDPGRVAQRWLTNHDGIYLTSGEQIAACLRLVADRLESVGEIHETGMRILLQPSAAGPEEEQRRSAIDAIAAKVGTYAQPTEMGNGSWQHTTNHRDDSIPAVQAYVGIKAPAEPEPADVAAAILTPDAAELPSAEAGETEDALGVPGLTAAEADDFAAGSWS